MVLVLGLRFKNPAEEAAPDRSVSLQQIESEWEGLRNRLKARLEELDERELRQAAGKHPIAGPLNLKEALALLVRHVEGHPSDSYVAVVETLPARSLEDLEDSLAVPEAVEERSDSAEIQRVGAK